MRLTWKKIAALLLGVLLCALLAPAVLAADAEAPAELEFSVSEWDGPSNDELFTEYVRAMFYGPSKPMTKSPGSLEQTLGPVKYAIEQRFKAMIQDVAAGERTNTQFEVDASDLELPEMETAEERKAFCDSIYYALLSDCTSSLYWHDVRLGRAYAVYSDKTVVLYFKVALDYRSADYEVDPDRIDAANTALGNVQEILASYASVSDVNKLRGYMYEICLRNVYNDDAAANSGSSSIGIDPWQLVYVFDNDPDTNVVCEGYSKAFEYLCNNTAFSSSQINCWCVSGDNHMWNIVRMDDGDNYVVDVTWSDDEYGSVTNYAMFLSYAVSGSVLDGFNLTYRNTTTARSYYFGPDSDGTPHPNMLNTYTEAELTISDHAYAGAHTHAADAPVRENVVAPTCTATGSCDEVTYCSVCGHEMSRQTGVVIPAAGHTAGQAAHEGETLPTCTEPGCYDNVVRCTVCQGIISSEHVDVNPLGHSPGQAAHEGETLPTCTEPGCYDNVVRCTVCQEIVSSEHVDVDPLGHSPGQAAHEGETLPTCTEPGCYDNVVRCTVCQGIISSEHVDVDPLGHSPGQAAHEGETLPTCTEPGCYDNVVRCTVCQGIISSQHIDVDPLGHDYAYDPDGWSWTGYTAATATFVCSHDASHKEIVAATITSERTEPSVGVAGKVVYTATVVYKGTSYTDTRTEILPALPTPTVAAPKITGQSADAKAVAGKTVTFTVTASGTGLKYQWYVQKKGTTAWAKVGGDSPSLTVTATADLDGAKYRCEVSNAGGKDTSQPRTLTVVTAPKITTQPKKASVKAGKKVTFKVKASGYDLTYQWYYQKPGAKKWVKIKNATKATYSFKAAKSKNGWKYRCTVKNAAGKVNSKAVKLTVK